MNPAKALDPAFLKFSGLEHSRCHNHKWAIIKEVNDALDRQEVLRNRESLPTNGASKSTEVESMTTRPHDDTHIQDAQEVETRKPDFTDKFQYMSFSCGPLRCIQTHCMGHPRSTPKTPSAKFGSNWVELDANPKRLPQFYSIPSVCNIHYRWKLLRPCTHIFHTYYFTPDWCVITEHKVLKHLMHIFLGAWKGCMQ